MKGIPLVAVLLLFLGLSCNAYAGAKEDFISAVKGQCGKSDDEAAKLATPGRSGNVVKFKLCSSATVQLDGSCSVTCTKDGSTIGG